MSIQVATVTHALAVPVDAKTQQIVTDCNLAPKLSRSVCLACLKSTLLMDSKQQAILYCAQIYRDIQIEVTNCTGFVARAQSASEES